MVTATGDGALAATELEKYAAAMQRKTGLYPHISTPQSSEAPVDPPKAKLSEDEHDLFTPQMRQQLDTVFSRMERITGRSRRNWKDS